MIEQRNFRVPARSLFFAVQLSLLQETYDATPYGKKLDCRT